MNASTTDFFSWIYGSMLRGKCLMATQVPDIWLILGSEWPNIVRKQIPKTKFTKKVNQAVLIAEDKGVPGCLANEDPWTWVQEGDPQCT